MAKTVKSETTYNHAFALAFSVSGSTHPAGEDLTDEMLYEALITRARALLQENEIAEAVGCPIDTYEEDR
jgi:hypothetical protein